MRRISAIIGAIIGMGVAGAFAGCASPQQINDVAIRHQQRANYYASRGDFERAADEQRAADKEHLKATERAYDEGLPPPPAPRQTRQ